jgi:hypothetical protein
VFGLDYEDGVAAVIGMRVRPGYEGRGLTRLIRQIFLSEYPEKTHFVFDGVLLPAAEEKLKKCETLYKTVGDCSFILRLFSHNVNGKYMQASGLHAC